MKQQKNTSTLGQNRIDYIVYHNTNAVSKLLNTYGFEAPEHPKHLSEAIKELTRKKGRKVIRELLQLHPDKDAILKLNLSQKKGFCHTCNKYSYATEDNHCSSCGNSNTVTVNAYDSFINPFKNYKDNALERYYDRVVKRSNTNPEDKNLAEEVQNIWNEIRTRKLALKKEDDPKLKATKRYSMTKNELLLFGVVFIAGTLVGYGLKFNFKNVK